MARIENEPRRELDPARTPHCPMCDRALESIYDYPFIQIKDLVKSPIPNVVRDLPREENIADKIKEFAKLSEVQRYLKELSSLKRALINIDDFKPNLPEWKNERDNSEKGFFKLGGKFYLHITDARLSNVARISVFSHFNAGSGVGWGFLEIAKLADIRYQGILNQPPGDILRGA